MCVFQELLGVSSFQQSRVNIMRAAAYLSNRYDIPYLSVHVFKTKSNNIPPPPLFFTI